MHCFTTKVDSTIIATSARDNTMHSIIPPDIASDEHTDGDNWGKFRHVYWSIGVYFCMQIFSLCNAFSYLLLS